MALKVELRPHERIIVGNCVITNTDQRARLLIDGDNVPILRERDILTPETADTPAKLVYLAVQLRALCRWEGLARKLAWLSALAAVVYVAKFAIDVSVDPGKESTWTIRYTFYEAKKG